MDILSPVIKPYLELCENYVEEAYPISVIEVGMKNKDYNKKHVFEFEEHDKVHPNYSYHEVVHT